MAEIAVAPCVGAWIETLTNAKDPHAFRSLPAWERGLKLLGFFGVEGPDIVAPCVGAWIETLYLDHVDLGGSGRSLRGSVD